MIRNFYFSEKNEISFQDLTIIPTVLNEFRFTITTTGVHLMRDIDVKKNCEEYYF